MAIELEHCARSKVIQKRNRISRHNWFHQQYSLGCKHGAFQECELDGALFILALLFKRKRMKPVHKSSSHPIPFHLAHSSPCKSKCSFKLSSINTPVITICESDLIQITHGGMRVLPLQD